MAFRLDGLDNRPHPTKRAGIGAHMGKAATRCPRQEGTRRPSSLHEIKLDGYRMHARLEAGDVRILTCRGHDWADKHPSNARAVAALRAQSAYLDGELCGLPPDGRTSFNLI